MKTKLGLITLIATVCLTLAVVPAHAGKVNLDNNHPSKAYAVKVSFISPLGSTDVIKCAAVNEEHEVNDPTASVVKFQVFEVDRCTNGQPGALGTAAMSEYFVSGDLKTTRNFTATVAPNGKVGVAER